jgi:hypothetical protein
MYCAATLVFGLGLYVSLVGLSANKQVAVQVKTLQKKAEVRVPQPSKIMAHHQWISHPLQHFRTTAYLH